MTLRSQPEVQVSEADAGQESGAGCAGAVATQAGRVTFHRGELNTILNLYGRKVAEGEWRDYAMDFLKEKAVFSIFRRSSEVPLYRIEKDPRFAGRQGAYSVIAPGGFIIKRGHDLSIVLRALDRPVRLMPL